MRKIIQFGDVLEDGIFVFTPFQEEEDYSDSVQVNASELVFADGSFRARGFDQSRKPSKTITKRFVLNDEQLRDIVVRNDKSVLGKDIYSTKQAYLSDFIDYVYRNLRGGVKRLYVQTEDGSLRWTYAEVVSIPYAKSFSEAKTWQAFSVDFVLHDPYFYEVGDGYTFYFNAEDLPITTLIDPCKEVLNMPNFAVTKDTRFANDFCDYQGVIVRNEDWQGYIGENTCLVDGCVEDPCLEPYGTIYPVSGDTVVSVCVTGSAGATRPLLYFLGSFDSPVLTNTENGYTFEYAGVIESGDYLIIDTDSAVNGEPEDMIYSTNILAFDINNVTISNNGFFDLEIGDNAILVEGGNSGAILGLNYFNKYHN